MKKISYVYADLIKNHKINPTTGNEWSINDVPEIYQAEVEQILNENEYIY